MKALTVTLSIIGLIIVVALATLLLASGVFLKPAYLEPWQKSYPDRFADPRVQFASRGLLAASSHNMQPWRVKLDADQNVFYLFADSERLTPAVDPLARQTLISTGTFLEYVRSAAGQSSRQAEMTFFPDGEYDEQNLSESMKNRPVARVTLSQAQATDADTFAPDAITSATANRAPYRAEQLSPEQVKQLELVNTDTELILTILGDERDRNTLGGYAREAVGIEAGIHRANAETAAIFRSNEYQKNRFRFGFSLEGQGKVGLMKHVMQGLLTLIPSLGSEKATASTYVASTQAALSSTAAYGLIITKGNSRLQQIRSGMLYSRLALTAQSLGIAMQPLSQPLEEYSEMADLRQRIQRDYAPNGYTIQMLFRLGKPTRAFPPSMRRDVTEIVK